LTVSFLGTLRKGKNEDMFDDGLKMFFLMKNSSIYMCLFAVDMFSLKTKFEDAAYKEKGGCPTENCDLLEKNDDFTLPHKKGTFP